MKLGFDEKCENRRTLVKCWNMTC